MSSVDGSVRVAISPTGEALAVKRAAPPGGGRLRHEAVVLERIAGPGVVRLGYVHDRPDGTVELATAYVGPRTLADVEPPRPAGEVAALGATLASTLARAHACDTVHGRLTADHVLLGSGDAPVVCGWGAAPAGSSPADDVAALGHLLLGLLPPARPGAADELVRTIAANCIGLEPGDRPPMTAIATALSSRAPAPGPARRLEARRAVALAGAALAAVAASLVAAGTGGSADAADPVPPATDGASGDFDAPEPPVPPVPPRRVWPAEPSTTATGPVPVLEHGGVRYAVGGPGDIALAADWSCSGAALPVVVRPATGAVYVFDAWPGGDEVPPGRVIADLGPAVAAAAEDVDGDGCAAELAVALTDGTTVVVRPSR